VILQEMWEKWVFVAALAGITCLMRASISDIAKTGASELAMTMFDECAMIATSQGFLPRTSFSNGPAESLSRPSRNSPRRCCTTLRRTRQSKRVTFWAIYCVDPTVARGANCSSELRTRT
jgi:ketopantoate reductase